MGSQLTDKKSVLAFVKRHKIEWFKVCVIDYNGILRGKYMSKTKFTEALDKGFGFCNVILGCDVDDHLCEDLSVTGWNTGYPDAHVGIIPSTGRILSFEPNTMLFLCEFLDEASAVCPRSMLKRVLSLAESMGYKVYTGFEYEFTVFDETLHTVREKNYQNLKTVTPDNFGYSILRSSVMSDFYQGIMQVCEDMGVPLESFHTEIGPGVMEAAITYSEAQSAADNAAIFKHVLKTLCEKDNKIATFMAKWSPEQQGQSGHMHISLVDKKGKNIFYDKSQDDTMSANMRSFIAGQIKYMPDLLAMVAGTVNDYLRLKPGFWAPVDANWGVDNRTSAIRAIIHSKDAQRVEYRLSSASSNPALALAAAILSGLKGIQENLQLDNPVLGNAYSADNEKHLPGNLYEAAQLFRHSTLAQEVFGDLFVNDYATTREWEQHEHDNCITTWQLGRYFERI